MTKQTKKKRAKGEPKGGNHGDLVTPNCAPTKGPWVAEVVRTDRAGWDTPHLVASVTTADELHLVASFDNLRYAENPPEDETVANIHCMAASRDMYDLLKQLCTARPSGIPALRAKAAAILSAVNGQPAAPEPASQARPTAAEYDQAMQRIPATYAAELDTIHAYVHDLESAATAVPDPVADPVASKAGTDVLPAGTYVLGDPCYVLGKSVGPAWDTLLDHSQYFGLFTDSGALHGKYPYNSGVFEINGKLCAVYHTFHGDGQYEDNHGRTYGVDAGMLAAIPIDLCDPAGLSTHNHVVTFDTPFRVQCVERNATLCFGDVEIETDPPYHEDEDDEDEFDHRNSGDDDED